MKTITIQITQKKEDGKTVDEVHLATGAISEEDRQLLIEALIALK